LFAVFILYTTEHEESLPPSSYFFAKLQKKEQKLQRWSEHKKIATLLRRNRCRPFDGSSIPYCTSDWMGAVASLPLERGRALGWVEKSCKPNAMEFTPIAEVQPIFTA
jgi:hypothetical protein